MRIPLRILLVTAIAVSLIAAGVAWERFCVSPLIEKAQRPLDKLETPADDLPAEVLEELANLGPAQAVQESRAVKPQVAANESGEDRTSTVHENVLRSGSHGATSGRRRTVAPVEVAETPKSPETMEDDLAARPIQQAQSAEWNAPAGRPAAPLRAGQSPRATTMPVSVEEAVPLAEIGNTTKTADVLDLMRQLRADDAEQQASARRELMRRGFSEVDLELARQLLSPDVEVRQNLARSVPRLSSVDASRWLMWLALDPERQVRLAAITTLATTGDPDLLERVEAMARGDSDSQIQALGDQIARQRDLAASRGDASGQAGGRNRLR